jgi:hypothetical protein
MMGLLDYHSACVIMFVDHFADLLKHSSLWPSADGTSMQKDLIQMDK